MASVRPIPPSEPQWALTLTAEERDVLLAALDFARSFLASKQAGKMVSHDGQYSHDPATYQRWIDPIEQALARTL